MNYEAIQFLPQLLCGISGPTFVMGFFWGRNSHERGLKDSYMTAGVGLLSYVIIELMANEPSLGFLVLSNFLFTSAGIALGSFFPKKVKL